LKETKTRVRSKSDNTLKSSLSNSRLRPKSSNPNLTDTISPRDDVIFPKSLSIVSENLTTPQKEKSKQNKRLSKVISISSESIAWTPNNAKLNLARRNSAPIPERPAFKAGKQIFNKPDDPILAERIKKILALDAPRSVSTTVNELRSKTGIIAKRASISLSKTRYISRSIQTAANQTENFQNENPEKYVTFQDQEDSKTDTENEDSDQKIARLRQNYERAQLEYENEMKALAIPFIASVRTISQKWVLRKIFQLITLDTKTQRPEENFTPSSEKLSISSVKTTESNRIKTYQTVSPSLLQICKPNFEFSDQTYTTAAETVADQSTKLKALKRPSLRKDSLPLILTKPHEGYLDKFVKKKQLGQENQGADVSDALHRLKKPRDHADGGIEVPIIPRSVVEGWKPKNSHLESIRCTRSHSQQKFNLLRHSIGWSTENIVMKKLTVKTENEEMLDKPTVFKVKGNVPVQKNYGSKKSSEINKSVSKTKTVPKKATPLTVAHKKKESHTVNSSIKNKRSDQLVKAQYEWLMRQIQPKLTKQMKTTALQSAGKLSRTKILQSNTDAELFFADAGDDSTGKIPTHLVGAKFRIDHIPVVTMKPVIIIEKTAYPPGTYHESLTAFISTFDSVKTESKLNFKKQK
ncbi:hypothetical protein HK100_002518, partial [Physocladia obscura]